MSYRKKNKSDLTTTNPLGRLPTGRAIGAYIKSIINNSLYDFHEWEAFRVTKVFTDRTSDLRGAVTGQFVIEPNQDVLGGVVRPFFGNGILQVPVAGEHVGVVEFNGRHYYIGTINQKGQIRENTLVDKPYPLPNLKFSEDDTFKRKEISPINITEGSTLYEGRFGQSIHFDRNKDNDLPVIRIGVKSSNKVLGGIAVPVDDSFENSDSMIVLTSGGEKFSKNKFEDGKIDGKKILLKSDGIFISGGQEIRLNSSNVKLGGADKLEPVVKGDTLIVFLEEILTQLGTAANAFTTDKGGGTALQAAIEELKLTLSTKKDSLLSKKVKTQ